MTSTALRALIAYLFLALNLAACNGGGGGGGSSGGSSGGDGSIDAPGVNGAVRAIVSDGLGNLYIAGDFTTAGGVAANYIAHWDGKVWSGLDSGMNSPVYALALDSAGNLYAGGDFTTAGGAAANHIARWNGKAWAPLGSGTDGRVHALASDRLGNLYAGGEYTSAGGAPAASIARWDGAAWSSMGGGVTLSDSVRARVLALVTDSNNNLYVGGSFLAAGAVPADGIARWNGSSWSSMGDQLHWDVTALALDANETPYIGLTANAQYGHVAKWTGTQWSVFGHLDGGKYVRALGIDGLGRLYVGGDFTGMSGSTANNIAYWDGSAWFALGSGMDAGVNALLVDVAGKGLLFAGGAFTHAGDQLSPYFARVPLGMFAYNGNDQSAGSAPIGPTSTAIGEEFIVADAGTLTRTDYTFSGWNTKPDGSGTPYAPGQVFSFGGDYVMLYAQWAPVTYAVTITAGANGTVTPASQTVIANGTATYSVTVNDPVSTFAELSSNTCGVAPVLTSKDDTTSTLTYSLSPITSDCTLNYNFPSQVFYIRLVDPGYRGTMVDPHTDRYATYGSTLTYTTNSVTYLTGCGGSQSGDIFTTAPITQNCTVYVNPR